MFVCDEHFDMPEEWKPRVMRSFGPCESCVDRRAKDCYDVPTSLWWSVVGRLKYPDGGVIQEEDV